MFATPAFQHTLTGYHPRGVRCYPSIDNIVSTVQQLSSVSGLSSHTSSTHHGHRAERAAAPLTPTPHPVLARRPPAPPPLRSPNLNRFRQDASTTPQLPHSACCEARAAVRSLLLVGLRHVGRVGRVGRRSGRERARVALARRHHAEAAPSRLPLGLGLGSGLGVGIG